MSDNPHSTGRADRGGLFERLRGMFGAPQNSVREDIEEALAETSEGDLSTHERSMLRSVLGLHELRVRDIMVPRIDIVAVEKTDTLGKILQLFRTAGHSRLPVYDGSLDTPLGMVHIRDFLELLAQMSAGTGPASAMEHIQRSEALTKFEFIDLARVLPVSKAVRPVLFAPPSMPVLDLLVRMQSERTHMALVIDEYGSTDGLVSIEDVVEIIVGDIEDEHDKEENPRIEKNATGDFTIEGRAPLELAMARTGVEFMRIGERDDVDTVAGFVAILAGKIPEKGCVVALSGDWEFEILDADRRRIKLVKLRRVADPAARTSGPTV